MASVSISGSELEVMKLLWERAPLSGPELVAGLEKAGCGWEENTIKTLLARLVKKGAVAQEGRKRMYSYRPLIGRDEYREEAAGRLVDQVFDSNPAELVCFFARQGRLSPEDIEELKAILKRKERE